MIPFHHTRPSELPPSPMVWDGQGSRDTLYSNLLQSHFLRKWRVENSFNLFRRKSRAYTLNPSGFDVVALAAIIKMRPFK